MKENSAAKHCAHDTLHCKFLVTSKSSPNTTIEFDRPPGTLDFLKMVTALLSILGVSVVVASCEAEHLFACFILCIRRTREHLKLPVKGLAWMCLVV